MSIGNTIRMAREKKGLTREQIAKKLKITPGYFGHIERDAPVPISERLVLALKKFLGLRLNGPMVERHNSTSKRVYRNYRKQQGA